MREAELLVLRQAGHTMRCHRSVEAHELTVQGRSESSKLFWTALGNPSQVGADVQVAVVDGKAGSSGRFRFFRGS